MFSPDLKTRNFRDRTEYYIEGVEDLHREDGPAIIRNDGTKEWWFNGKRHRMGGPAVIHSSLNGEWSNEARDVEWWNNGKLHREDGPAIVVFSTQMWFINGKHHRLDGPATIWITNKRQYFVEDVEYYLEEDYIEAIISRGCKEIALDKLISEIQ